VLLVLDNFFDNCTLPLSSPTMIRRQFMLGGKWLVDEMSYNHWRNFATNTPIFCIFWGWSCKVKTESKQMQNEKTNKKQTKTKANEFNTITFFFVFILFFPFAFVEFLFLWVFICIIFAVFFAFQTLPIIFSLIILICNNSFIYFIMVEN